MTFLVDEKDIEIAEVRLSLQENEAIRMELSQKMKQKEEKLIELESDLEDANSMLQKANMHNEQVDAQIVEMKAIIQQQEQEIITVSEKLESGNAKSDNQSKEFQSKVQSLENELQDSRHRLLEVEMELEYVKTSLKKAATEKQELEEIVRAYSEAIRGNDSMRITGNEESLSTQLQRNLERLSTLRNSANELEIANIHIKNAAECRRLLDENVEELQSLLKEEKAAQQEAVAELEDRLKFAVNDKMATEAELLRILEEKESKATKGVMDVLACEEKESGLPLESGMVEENVRKLDNEIANLKDEIRSWESLAKAKELALEEEKRARADEITRCTQCFEEQKHQLLEQLRQISSLKVKHSEECTEKDAKIEELETKVSNAAKSASYYESTIEHYRLIQAQLEHERDTVLMRLENQVRFITKFYSERFSNDC